MQKCTKDKYFCDKVSLMITKKMFLTVSGASCNVEGLLDGLGGPEDGEEAATREAELVSLVVGQLGDLH